MTYTIVLTSGEIRRLLLIEKYHISKDYVVFFVKDSEKTYTYPRCIIASVVFYP